MHPSVVGLPLTLKTFHYQLLKGHGALAVLSIVQLVTLVAMNSNFLGLEEDAKIAIGPVSSVVYGAYVNFFFTHGRL